MADEVFTGDEIKHWCTCSPCSERSRLIDEAAARRTEAQGDNTMHPQRHEFHLLDTFTAYCICGWTCTEYSTTDPPNLITPRVAQQYRDHLG